MIRCISIKLEAISYTKITGAISMVLVGALKAISIGAYCYSITFDPSLKTDAFLFMNYFSNLYFTVYMLIGIILYSLFLQKVLSQSI
jgi:hypothetical protein